MRTAPAPSRETKSAPSPRSLAPQQLAGGALVLVGVTVMMLGWWGMSGTENLLHQFSYLMSGGLMGAAAVAVGLTVLLGYEHARDRANLAEVLARLEQIEDQVGSLVDHVAADQRRARAAGPGARAVSGNGKPARASARRPSA